MNWLEIQLSLTLISPLHYPREVEETKRLLLAFASEFDFSIDVRCYSLDELRNVFGLA